MSQKNHFYRHLSPQSKIYFEHRIVKFLTKFKFIARDIAIDDAKKIQIAATAIALTFGLHRYLYKGFNKIILYPRVYFSTISRTEHKGETNPKLKTIVLSWEDYKTGNNTPNDNINLGYHEFTHALHFSFLLHKNSYSAYNFLTNYKSILVYLENKKVKQKIIKEHYFRDYAFENQYEFLAVIIENYFESPIEFKNKFPYIFSKIKALLNVNYH